MARTATSQLPSTVNLNSRPPSTLAMSIPHVLGSTCLWQRNFPAWAIKAQNRRAGRAKKLGPSPFQLRIWPSRVKLSRQDAATAIRQDVLAQRIRVRRAAKPRPLASGLRATPALRLSCICTTDFQSLGGNLCRRTGSPSYPEMKT